MRSIPLLLEGLRDFIDTVPIVMLVSNIFQFYNQFKLRFGWKVREREAEIEMLMIFLREFVKERKVCLLCITE